MFAEEPEDLGHIAEGGPEVEVAVEEWGTQEEQTIALNEGIRIYMRVDDHQWMLGFIIFLNF